MHVLSLPPAFALSQDQTLTLKDDPISKVTYAELTEPHLMRTAFPPLPVSSSKRSDRRSLVKAAKPQAKAQDRQPARTPPPTFLFLVFTCQRARRPKPPRSPPKPTDPKSPGSRQGSKAHQSQRKPKTPNTPQRRRPDEPHIRAHQKGVNHSFQKPSEPSHQPPKQRPANESLRRRDGAYAPEHTRRQEPRRAVECEPPVRPRGDIVT